MHRFPSVSFLGPKRSQNQSFQRELQAHPELAYLGRHPASGGGASRGKRLRHVVLTLTHRYNAVRGHRTGSDNSGAEDYLRKSCVARLLPTLLVH